MFLPPMYGEVGRHENDSFLVLPGFQSKWQNKVANSRTTSDSSEIESKKNPIPWDVVVTGSGNDPTHA